LKEADALNHSLGQYIGIAVKNPKKYPNKPFLHKEEQQPIQRNMSDNQMELEAKRIAKMFGGEIRE
jgi:hypothetical protein